MSKTGELDRGESQEVRSGIISTGTGILKVFERPEGQIWTLYDLHCNPENLREARTCRRPVYWIV